jgi:pimeloyl-ACP methyl ester carboxylesterase
MYVRTRLGRLWVEERGVASREGAPAIVLWHSLLCDGGMWRGQVGPLSALGRVILFDGPGHGRSDVPEPFDLRENVAAIGDALDALRVDRAIWIGLSWGGMVGMRLALAHPRRVAALALMDTAARKDTRLRRLRYAALAMVVRPAGLPRGLFDAQIAPKMFAPRTLRERPELADELFERLSSRDPTGIGRAAIAVTVTRDDIEPALKGIRCPTLVLHGDEDRALPLSWGRAIADRIPGARMAVIRGAGHLAALEQPDAVNAELVPFVREHL